jgi:hypothetical protein
VALVGGLLLAAVSAAAARSGGQRKARRTDEALRSAIGSIAADRVVAPVQRELDQYGTYRAGVTAALG